MPHYVLGNTEVTEEEFYQATGLSIKSPEYKTNTTYLEFPNLQPTYICTIDKATDTQEEILDKLKEGFKNYEKIKSHDTALREVSREGLSTRFKASREKENHRSNPLDLHSITQEDVETAKKEPNQEFTQKLNELKSYFLDLFSDDPFKVLYILKCDTVEELKEIFISFDADILDSPFKLYSSNSKNSLSGVKHNKNKPDMELIARQFPNALKLIALSSMYGGHHYKDYDKDGLNFSRVPGGSKTYKSALLRHYLEQGLDESGLDHTIATAWNGLAMLELWAKENIENVNEFCKEYLKKLYN